MSKNLHKCLLELHFLIRGLKINERYESPHLSVDNHEVEYNGIVLSNCILLRYQVHVFQDSAIPKQDSINDILLTEIDVPINILSLLLTRPTQLITFEATLDGTKVELKLPPRDFPLGLYNFTSFWNRPDTRFRYSSKVRANLWPELENTVNKFRQMLIGEKYRLFVPLHWFTKGTNEMSSLDRFVAFWISFNALYSDPSKREQEAIMAYVQKSPDAVFAKQFVQDQKELLSKLSSFSININRRKTREISKELKRSLNTSAQNHAEIIQNTILTIYGIRNNLFHGDIDLNMDEDQKQIRFAERLLSILVRNFIFKEILGHSLLNTKFVITEELSF